MDMDFLAPELHFCRLCAVKKPVNELLHLQSDSTQSHETFEKMTRLSPSLFLHMFSETVLPKTACYQCIEGLDRAVEFLDKIEKAQVALRSAYMLQIKMEPPINRESSSDFDSSDEDLGIDEAPAQSTSAEKKAKKAKKKPTKKIKPVKVETCSDSYSEEDDEPIVPKPTWRDYVWICFFCDVEFPNPDALKAHSMEHHETCNAFRCFDCKTRKHDFDGFIEHIRMHRKYLSTCHLCTFVYVKRSDPQKHKRMHRVPNTCRGCNTSFSNPIELNNHMAKYYKADRFRNDRGDEKLDEADFICPICDKRFTTKASMKKHIPIHTNRQRNSTCDKCGKCFYNKETLASHLRQIHTDARPFECKICKQTFKLKSNLRLHIISHDNVKPFKCSECGKSFRRRTNLNMHSLIHSDYFPHVCPYCDKGFRFSNLLKQHIRQHTGVKPYSCAQCNRDFTNWANYNKHMKRRHGMDMAKKKRTPNGAVPIDPATGEPIQLETHNIEEWKKSILTPKMYDQQRSLAQQYGYGDQHLV